MNRQTLLIIFGGFFMAVLVAISIQLVIGSKQQEVVAEKKKSFETTYILVASSNLDKGDTLKASHMKWQEWPQSAIFSTAIEREDNQSVEDALTGMLLRDVKKGEALMKSAVAKEKTDNFIAASLGENMRAASITVNAVSSVSGFVSPGDHTDIIMTYDLRLPSDPAIRAAAMQVINKRAVQTILQNVKIIAVDQNAKKQDKAKVSRTVTLEVTQEQAEILALAATMGKLSLSLRKFGDDKIVIKTPETHPAITDLRLSNVMQEMLTSSPDKNRASTKKRIMRLYNGTQSTNITIN